MRELSLHINDIVENSIEANASFIEIIIVEDIGKDLLSIEISDNGHGIEVDKLKNITNPFITSRISRRIGLGLSLFETAANRCGGKFTIQSQVGVGTIVKAEFIYSHIDRAPLGNMTDTILTILLSLKENCDLKYIHKYNNNFYQFDTRSVKAKLGENIPLTHLEVIRWAQESIYNGLLNLVEVQ